MEFIFWSRGFELYYFSEDEFYCLIIFKIIIIQSYTVVLPLLERDGFNVLTGQIVYGVSWIEWWMEYISGVDS